MPMSPSEAIRSGLSALDSAIADQNGKLDSLRLLRDGCQHMLRQEESYIKALENLSKENEELKSCINSKGTDKLARIPKPTAEPAEAAE